MNGRSNTWPGRTARSTARMCASPWRPTESFCVLVAPPRLSSFRNPALQQGIAGVVLFAVVLEITARAKLLGTSWPPLTQVAAALTAPANIGLFQRGLSATL